MLAIRIVLISVVLGCLFHVSIQKAIEQNAHEEKKAIHTVKRSQLIDDMNTCIDACSECLQDDLLNADDSEDSPVLTCANECVLHTNPRKVMIQLLRRSVFDKEFAICFMNLTFKNN